MEAKLNASPGLPITDGVFRLLVEQAQDYAIFLLDPEGHVASWNDGAARIKQYKASEIIGKHFSIFYASEDIKREWPKTELARALIDGRYEDTGWRLRKDGSRFWANVVITALRNSAGQLIGYSKITRDLTERKRADEELRRSEERFRLLVDGVQDYAVYMLDPRGLVTSWNYGAWRIKGYSANEILGKHFSRFYPSEDIDAGKPWAELVVAREHGRAEDEGWRVRKDGSRFWARVAMTALYDADGELSGFAKVTQDMTLRRSSADLEETAKRMNEFIAVLAHELRNPLAPIRTAATIMGQIGPGDPRYSMVHTIIDRQSAQLSRLVDDLIDISRVTRGTLEITPDRINLSEVLRQAEETARPNIESNKHKLEVRVPDEPVWVQGDSVRLAQAISNVLNNAARYTNPGGCIRVELGTGTGDAQSPMTAVLSIRDTGLGIEPHLLPAIFGMFVQGRTAQTADRGGLGIGLALTRSIIELHHGTVDAISEGAGKGSEFVIKLPLAAAERRLEESIMIRSATVVPVTRRKRILVVDDNVDAATMLCTLLQSMGHEVAIANTGAEALRLAESDRPQVVCLDIGMPGMDGLEIARRIRQRDRHPRPLIIAITGWGQPEDQAQSQEAGIDVHLLKPAEKVTLCRILDQHAEAA